MSYSESDFTDARTAANAAATSYFKTLATARDYARTLLAQVKIARAAKQELGLTDSFWFREDFASGEAEKMASTIYSGQNAFPGLWEADPTLPNGWD